MGWPWDKAKKAVQSVDPRQIVQEEINKLKGTLKREIVNEIKKDFNSVKQKTDSFQKKFNNIDGLIQSKVRTSFNSLEGKVDTLGNQINKELLPLKEQITNFTGNFDDLIIQALELALKKIKKAICNEGERVVGVALPDRFGAKIAVIEMGYNQVDRSQIKGFFHGITQTKEITKEVVLDIIERIAPDWVKINIEGELPIVPAGFGIYPEWDTKKFLEYGRELLKIK